jgi:uncharacterized repeat protein (TIGR01451 family)
VTLFSRITSKGAAPAAIALALSAIGLFSAASAPALAATGPVWRVDSASNTTVAPGSMFDYFVHVTNVGDAATTGPITLTITLPPGVTSVAESGNGSLGPFDMYSCTGVSGASVVTCTSSFSLPSAGSSTTALQVSVGPSASGTLTSTVEVSGGGATIQTQHDVTSITAAKPSFGIDSFDGLVDADAGGSPFTQAGGHPYAASTSIAFNTLTNANPLLGPLWPVEPVKDVAVDLPPGFVGNPTVAAQCTVGDLANALTPLDVRPLCSPASQLGTVIVTMNNATTPLKAIGPLPVFNLVPPPGVPARFGFNVLGTVVSLNAHLRSSGDYGLSVDVNNIPEGISVAANSLSFWGVPADPSHDAQRACPGQHAPGDLFPGPSCSAGIAAKAFLRNPTSCSAPAGSAVTDGLLTFLHIDSWEHPARFSPDDTPDLSDPNWKSSQFTTHLPPGVPQVGPHQLPTGCANVPFEPSITVQPTSHAADSPTGLDVDLTMPQEALEDPNAIAQADVRDSVVIQPVGTRVNPAAADGLTGCSAAQIGIHDSADPSCPDSAKIGTVEIISPLQKEPLTGSIYQARQDENPFGATLAFYTVAKGSGLIIKLAAEVRTDPDTGQVTTIFRNSPQLPFSHYRLHFDSGSRAPLITPSTCGTKTTHASFTPWSGGAAVESSDSFQIDEGPHGTPCANSEAERPFKPSFSAGTTNPLAGAFSPFVLKLSREDGTQELSSLETTLPPGLIGKLAGIPYCPEPALAAAAAATGAAERAAPACPPASQVGITDAAAGAGPDPFHIAGTAYLAGPYKGAPLSLAIVTPALAGPLDLGTVLVRAALYVDPTSAQIHVVSDPLPLKIVKGGDGFLLDLRSVTVQMNRPDFTLNPTSCDPMAVAGVVGGAGGAVANVSSRFQVGNCDKLAFKPKLSLSLKGGTRRTKFPALKAVLTYPKGSNANIAKAQVTLPHSAFLEQGHIKTVCTRPQLASHTCPAASIYGRATAVTPLLDKPLSGPVYLGVGFGHKLPDLVADLNGQIEVLLNGKVDTGKEDGLRNTFVTVPDAPVSKFTLELFGGKKGLIVNSENLCSPRAKTHAVADFTAQNGKVYDTNPVVKSSCRGKGKKKGKGKQGR